MSDIPCCTHMRVSYKTEPCDAPNIRGEIVPGLGVRGWWDCDTCGKRFLPITALTAAINETNNERDRMRTMMYMVVDAVNWVLFQTEKK